MKASRTFLALALSAVVSTVQSCNPSTCASGMTCSGTLRDNCLDLLAAANDAADDNDVTVPAIPDVTVPAIPDVTLPDITLPAVTIPALDGITLPAVTIPALDGIPDGIPPLTLPPNFEAPPLPADVEIPAYELPADVTVPSTLPDADTCPGYYQLQQNNCIDPTNDCEQIVTEGAQCNQAIVNVANTAGCGAWQGIAAQILQGCNAELEAGLIAAGITDGVAGMGQDMSAVITDTDVLASLPDTPDVSGVTDTANDVADAASGAVSDVVGDTGDAADAAGDAAGDAADAAGDAAGDAADAAGDALNSLNAGQRPGAGLPAVALLAALAMVMSGFPM